MVVVRKSPTECSLTWWGIFMCGPGHTMLARGHPEEECGSCNTTTPPPPKEMREMCSPVAEALWLQDEHAEDAICLPPPEDLLWDELRTGEME